MTSLSCTRSVNWLCAAHKHNLTHSAQYIKGHNSRTKIQFFWDVTQCCWCVVSKFRLLTLKMKAVRSFETSVTAHQVTQCHIAEDLNLQQHLKCRISIHCVPHLFYCSKCFAIWSCYCSSTSVKGQQQLMALYTLYTLCPTLRNLAVSNGKY
jgi:hypothetical protein